MLLLDEATSALDKVNERAVQKALDDYCKMQEGGVTIIAIAHRLSTIKDADNILVLKHGSLIEEGNHDQIIAKHPDGVYHGFVQKQQSAEAEAEEGQEAVANLEELDKSPALPRKGSIRSGKSGKSNRSNPDEKELTMEEETKLN